MLKQALKSALLAPIRNLQHARARPAIESLIREDDPRLRALGNALRELLDASFSPEEQAKLWAIERRRRELLQSTQRVSVIDYGAGKPNSKRTEAEMADGVCSTRSISDLCRVSKPRFWTQALFKIVRKLEPSSCVELGSCVGISAAYQAAALELNGKGRLTTIEGSPAVAAIAKETMHELGYTTTTVVEGSFQAVLKSTFEKTKPVDFIFNDGHHDQKAVLRYFEEALPYVAGQAVVVFDDISLYPGMRKAWADIREHNKVSATVDLNVIGIAFLGGVPSERKTIKIPLN